MARPSVDLDWAENDVVDPTSGQNNKVEPPTAWKNNGWGYQEKPPRNYDNYHKWNAGQWIKYLDGEVITRTATYFVAANDASAEAKLHADAVCDGTDDHVQINAALAAIASTGGKVLLSEGTFVVAAAISITSNIYLQGMGVGATEIKVADSDSGTWNILSVSGQAEVTISDLKINGNSASATGNNTGIDITNSTDVIVDRVFITSISRNASQGDGINFATAGQRLKISGCTIASCEYRGINVNAGGPLIEQCHIYGNTDVGVYLNSTYASLVNCSIYSNTKSGVELVEDYCRVSDCQVYTNGEYGIKMASDFCVIDDNHVIENDYDGIILNEANYNTVEDNILKDNSQDTADTYSGINLSANADSNVVQGNISRSASDQKYGIDCSSSTNYVVGNYLLGGGVSGALNGTVKTSWGSNQVYDGVSAHVNITGAMVNVTA